jgi:hypothetical protein
MRTVTRPTKTIEKPEPETTTTAPPWSASTTCSCCGDYVPCGCEARAKPPTPAPAQEGNLCACLVTFARWRKCCVCGSETLFVDERGHSDADLECGLCVAVREGLARRLRFAKLASRLRGRLAVLFTSTNDNHGAVLS